MKKIFLLLGIILLASPVLAKPGGPGGPGGHGGPGIHGGPGGHGAGIRGSVSMHGGGHGGMVSRPIHSRPAGPAHIGGRPPVRYISHRPPMPPRPYRYRPIVMPYYSSFYYPATYYTSYSYYPATTTTYVNSDGYGETVVVRESPNYAGINTAANVINAAANVATAIRFLTW